MPAQLTLAHRTVLAALLTQQLPKTEIARRLGFHRSTVYRELKRNSGPIGYIYQEAQQRTDVRRKLRRRAWKLEDPRVKEFVCRGLQNRWSPEQIAGREARVFALTAAEHLATNDLQLDRSSGEGPQSLA